MLKIVVKLIFILSFFYITNGFSQEKVYKGDADISFATARNLAFNNQRKQAQDTLQFILTKYPDYHDVRSFLGTTYSWDGDYKKAKSEFEYILGKDPENKPAWTGIIQNEFWAGAPYEVLLLSEKALKKFPDDEDILLFRAKAQEKTNNSLEALKTVKTILAKNPNHQATKDFKIVLNKDLNTNTIGIIAAADFYSKTFDPMQYYSLKYGRLTKYGSFNVKYNINRRQDQNGQQFEIEAYPKITKGLYGYANFGYSNSILFPKTKFAGELFKALPKGFEVSLGARVLNYTTTTVVYTASGSWYNGNNFWMIRPYITPDDKGTSLSTSLNYRRYLRDAYNYFGVSAGFGYSPEINQFNYTSAEQRKFNMKSQKVNLSYYFTSPNEKNAFGTQFGITHQEQQFNPGSYYWVYFVAFSWDLRFR